MQTAQSDYFSAYRQLKLTRDAKGVLVVEFHSNGGPCVMNAQGHTEFVDAFYRIGQDRANKIVIVTGAGGDFIIDVDWSSFGEVSDPEVWSQVHDEGVQVLENIANIRVPVIAAIEGRAYVHSDYALLANVIVAGESATFQDVAHYAQGVTPGDGIFTTWSYRGGAGRAEAFLLDPKPLPARTAQQWGSGRGNCAKRAGAQSRAGIGRAVPEGSGGYTSQHTRTFHPAVEGTRGAGSRLWACARRIVLRRSREIKTGQERTSCADEKDWLRSPELQ
jgi:enoyl-CoA hydratase/carnithine racemase